MTDPIPRTQEAIAQRLRAVEKADTDFTGVQRSRLLDALDYEHAKPWLVPEVKAEEWDADPMRIRCVEDVRSAILDYLPFAWSKANGGRGISALRSIAHFSGLVWLMGPDAWSKLQEAGEYRFYGKPQLVTASELVGFDWKKADNDEWLNQHDEDPITATEALGS